MKYIIAGLLALAVSTGVQARSDDPWDVKEALASAIAKTSHQFQPHSSKLQLSLGAGYYDGRDALDVAVGKRVFDNLFININLGSTGGHEAIGVGFLWTFE